MSTFRRYLVWILALCFLPLGASADNLAISPGFGKTAATDSISGVEYPRQKITLGADNSNDGDLSFTNRMPTETGRSDVFSGVNASPITDTTSTQIVAAGSTGVFHYLSTITIANAHASVGTLVDVYDGAALKWTCPASPNFGGCVVAFNPPLRLTAATAINCKPRTTGASVTCSFSGFDLSK
jgi:hypothetical protein